MGEVARPSYRVHFLLFPQHVNQHLCVDRELARLRAGALPADPPLAWGWADRRTILV